VLIHRKDGNTANAAAIGGSLRIDVPMKRGARYGQLYLQKVAKNFGQSAFLSACEIEHGQFRAFFACMFWPKMQNGRISFKKQKEAFSSQRSAFSQTDTRDPE